MFDGKHCTKEDLDLLVLNTNNVLNALSEGDRSGLDSFLKLIDRFDVEVSRRICYQIKDVNDVEKLKRIISNNIDELKQNVLVDINEHRGNL